MTEPQPWPRAQRMSFVVVGERAQPHHRQAIAEYDEVRGETTPRHHGPGMYTAANINQAIEWWNRRAELEAATAVPERLPDDRLAEIRTEIEADSYGHSYDGGRAARELLAEVDRMRALEVPMRFLEASIEATPEQIAEWQRYWDELIRPSDEFLADLDNPIRLEPRTTRFANKPRRIEYPFGG